MPVHNDGVCKGCGQYHPTDATDNTPALPVTEAELLPSRAYDEDAYSDSAALPAITRRDLYDELCRRINEDARQRWPAFTDELGLVIPMIAATVAKQIIEKWLVEDYLPAIEAAQARDGVLDVNRLADFIHYHYGKAVPLADVRRDVAKFVAAAEAAQARDGELLAAVQRYKDSYSIAGPEGNRATSVARLALWQALAAARALIESHRG